MPVKMVLHYDHRLASLGGRVVVFQKDVERMVADDVVDECIAIGARAVEGEIKKTPPAKPPMEPIVSGVARVDAIKESLAKLILKNNADDFAGTGRPKIAVVSRDVGFKVEAHEVSKIWDDMNNPVAQEMTDGSGNE